MDLTLQFDAYCERVGFAFWAEPVNAITNLGFVLAALWAVSHCASRGARVLAAILGAIGVGSFLFHTFATGWASLADTIPIGLFILVYLWLVNRDLLRLRPVPATLLTAGFIPFAALTVWGLGQVPFLRISAPYWTVPILLVIYGALHARYRPEVTRGFLAGAALLSVSIVLRSLDDRLCGAFPLGTHFAWHLLNAVMLGFMIAVYDRRIAPGGPLAALRPGR